MTRGTDADGTAETEADQLAKSIVDIATGEKPDRDPIVSAQPSAFRAVCLLNTTSTQSGGRHLSA